MMRFLFGRPSRTSGPRLAIEVHCNRAVVSAVPVGILATVEHDQPTKSALGLAISRRYALHGATETPIPSSRLVRLCGLPTSPGPKPDQSSMSHS